MRAKEFIVEAVSTDQQLTYIARFIDSTWNFVDSKAGCIATALMHSVIEDASIDSDTAFKTLTSLSKKKGVDISNVSTLISLINRTSFVNATSGIKTKITVSMHEPTLQQVIGLLSEDHPSVLVFDSAIETSPFMQNIVDNEKDPNWDGIATASDKIAGYQYPPDKVPNKAAALTLLGMLSPENSVGSDNHALLVVGHDRGENVLVCREQFPDKSKLGFIKFPIELVGYTKLLTFTVRTT